MERPCTTYTSYKCCVVPKCRNTTVTAPRKYFFSVPRNQNLRQKWWQTIGRYKQVSPKSFLHICEDHFDVETDTENLMRYRLMKVRGHKISLRLKRGVLPHKCLTHNHHPFSPKTSTETEENTHKIENTDTTYIVPEYQEIQKEDSQPQINIEVQTLDLPVDQSPLHIDENPFLDYHQRIDTSEVQNPQLQDYHNYHAENPDLEYDPVIDTEHLLQYHHQNSHAMADAELGRPIYRECRACLKIGESAGFVDIFLAKDPPWCWNKETTIAEELARIAQVEISNTDKCSDVVCFSCCLKLYNATQFVTMVQESDQILKARLSNPSTSNNKWPKPIQLETEVNEAILGNVPEVDIKEEVLSEEDKEPSDSIDGGDKPDLHMEIKVEPEEIVQSAPIQVTVNGTIASDQMKEMSNGCEIYYAEEYLNEYIKEEPISDEESGPFDLPLECMLCAKDFLSVSGLKAHVMACHSYKSVRRRSPAEHSPAKPKQRHICSICRRCFWTLTDLMVHETCHNKFHCYGCQMKFDSFGALLKHRQKCAASNTHHHQVKTLKDAVRSAPTEVIRKSLFECTQCNEKFTNEHNMNVHNEVHHSLPNSETDNDKVSCKRKENGDLEAEEKHSNKMETDSLELEMQKSNEMETEPLELEMQKIHEGSNSGSFKENIESPNIGHANETANENISIDKSLNKVEEPDKIKEIVIEVNVKNLTDSNSPKDEIESSNKIKQEPETKDEETNCVINTNENNVDTSKLESTESLEGQKNMIEIEIDTVKSIKDNAKQKIDDNFACSMMKMDSY